VTDSRNALGLVVGIVGIALLGGSAWYTSKRRGGER
jgi:LPXTG-motif cell wall-anchored protein